jgi:hypothetical protein
MEKFDGTVHLRLHSLPQLLRIMIFHSPFRLILNTLPHFPTTITTNLSSGTSIHSYTSLPPCLRSVFPFSRQLVLRLTHATHYLRKLPTPLYGYAVLFRGRTRPSSLKLSYSFCQTKFYIIDTCPCGKYYAVAWDSRSSCCGAGWLSSVVLAIKLVYLPVHFFPTYVQAEANSNHA